MKEESHRLSSLGLLQTSSSLQDYRFSNYLAINFRVEEKSAFSILSIYIPVSLKIPPLEWYLISYRTKSDRLNTRYST